MTQVSSFGIQFVKIRLHFSNHRLLRTANVSTEHLLAKRKGNISQLTTHSSLPIRLLLLFPSSRAGL